MNVLHVVENFGGAGLENVVKDLAIGSLDTIVKPYVCVLNRQGVCGEKAKNAGIQVFELKKKLLGKKDSEVIYSLKQIVKKLNIDLIHVHNFTPLYYVLKAFYFSNIKIIVTFHGFIDWTAKKWFFFNIAFPRIKIVVVNEKMKPTYSFLGLFFRNRIKTIINGIRLDRFRKNKGGDLRRSLGIEESTFLIGSIGRLSPVKNQILQIKTLHKLKQKIADVKLLLITGHSPDSCDLKKQLLKQADELGVKDSLVLLDFRQDVPELLSIMDVFLSTSLTEGTSLVLLEAMAVGLPLIASDVGGNSKIIENGKNGFLFNLIDEKEIVLLMEKLNMDPFLRKNIGGNALKSSQNYSTENMCSKYLELYNSE